MSLNRLLFQHVPIGSEFLFKTSSSALYSVEHFDSAFTPNDSLSGGLNQRSIPLKIEHVDRYGRNFIFDALAHGCHRGGAGERPPYNGLNLDIEPEEFGMVELGRHFLFGRVEDGREVALCASTTVIDIWTP